MFALHAAVLASGYRLVAVGDQAKLEGKVLLLTCTSRDHAQHSCTDDMRMQAYRICAPASCLQAVSTEQSSVMMQQIAVNYACAVCEGCDRQLETLSARQQMAIEMLKLLLKRCTAYLMITLARAP